MTDPTRILQKDVQRGKVIEIPGNFPGGFDTLFDSGSFVPGFAGTTTPGTFTITSPGTLVAWSRIGNRVEFNGRIVYTAVPVAPTGNMQITGFPFAGVSEPTMAIAGGGFVFYWNFNVAAGYTSVGLQAANASTSMIFTKSGDNLNGAPVAAGEINATADLRFWGQYRVG
jgi:hypothetical protein